ncbi:MAG: Fe-S cluster assembly scaffold protein NifU [Patescibacteria group bacterium]|nr:Fe-S cluster assembly scaffold protein NifU [Patescibacteria group bacterium]
MYSKKVMDHFTNPRNMGVIKDPDGIGEVGNPVCGDIMKIFIKVARKPNIGEFISDIKFQTLGCGSAIATSSMITELAKGRSLKQAGEITRDNVASELDGLPPEKMHCSNLAADALKKAIKNYKRKKKEGRNAERKKEKKRGGDRKI